MTERIQRDNYPQIIPITLILCALLTALAFLLSTPASALMELTYIIFTPDTLITDYMALAGPGGAFLNAALVTLAALGVLVLSHAPMNGSACGALGLIAGFSLFGKDIANIWPILLGGFLYAKFQGESFGKYASMSLMSTTLAPVVSALWFNGGGAVSFLGGCLVGVAIGFFLPILATYTFRVQKGMNFYNVGFSCGLIALMLVPILAMLGLAPDTVLFWSTGHNRSLGIFLFCLCFSFAVWGLVCCGRSVKEALGDYWALLHESGRAPCDLLKRCGAAAVCINVGVTGAIATGYILLIGGDLNGPTLAGIFTIMGFAAWGKHPGNMLPVMAGAVLAGLALPGFSLTDPAVQFSVLFCTTLAPIAGSYGWVCGILAGFLHICLVQRTGAPVCGLNLYNNGFTGGLIATVLYGVLTPLGLLRHPEERDKVSLPTPEPSAPPEPSAKPETSAEPEPPAEPETSPELETPTEPEALPPSDGGQE